jgi:glycosyltransferase involved in cell wall biosynthesis
VSPPDRPLVSVVLPAYNAAGTLGAALDGALAQTYHPLEILVVDDGSTDGTPEVIRRFGGAIRAFRQANGGVSTARNRAIREAKGDLIAFLDADDEWLPAKTEKQVAYLNEHPDIALLYAGIIHLDRDGREAPHRPHGGGEDTYAHLFQANRIPTSSVMVRRAALDRSGLFEPALRVTQDYDLWLRIAADHRYAGLQERLVRYRFEGGLSADHERRYLDHLLIVDRAPLRPELGVDGAARERARAFYQWRLGRLLARAGRWDEAALRFGAILERPARYRTRRKGAAHRAVPYWRALRWHLWCRLRRALSRPLANGRSMAGGERPRPPRPPSY